MFVHEYTPEQFFISKISALHMQQSLSALLLVLVVHYWAVASFLPVQNIESSHCSLNS